ncbi:hypothetical protein Taro_014972, partial [Colocasia esculenta]|nr:hypothetical protein [Colocasia esculenta]
VGGERVVGGDLLPFLHLHHRQEYLFNFRYVIMVSYFYPYRTHDLCISTIDNSIRPTTSASPSQMASGFTPPPSELVHADDETSHHEGEASYSGTMQVVWINEGNKIEPTQASQFITKTIQAQFSGPIHRFFDFLMDVQDLLYAMFMRNYRFTELSDESHDRSAWTSTAKANFKHLLYNIR